jgi:hypothetical protein
MLKQYRSTRAIPACVTVDVTSCVERSVRMPRVPSAFVVKRSTMADAKMLPALRISAFDPYRTSSTA